MQQTESRIRELADLKSWLSRLQKQVDQISDSGSISRQSVQHDMPQSRHLSSVQQLTETRALTRKNSLYSGLAADTVQLQPLHAFPRYRGLSSPAFTFALAQQSLEAMSLGLSTDIDEVTSDSNIFLRPQSTRSSILGHSQRPADPLFEILREQTHDLIDVFDEEVGHVYPVADVGVLHQNADLLHDLVQLASQTGAQVPPDYRLSGVERVEIDILLVVLANGLFLQEHSQSNLGLRLFDKVKVSVERLTSATEVSPRHILLLLLSVCEHIHRAIEPHQQYVACQSISYFCQDEEVLAWRTVGLAARLSQEIDLHGLGTSLTTNQEGDEGVRIIRLFWSIYILDRRWSLGTGLPFTLKESDIDTSLPKPVGSSLTT